jgi:hypothetical protein
MFVVCALVLLGACLVIWWQARGLESRRQQHVQEIVAMIGRDATPDAARTFITANSVHKTDAEFRKGEHAAKLIAYAKGKSAEPAHMECSTRSNLLQHVLNEMGYRTRKVAIFDTDTNMESHTLLDVWNATARRWETQDADFGIWWQDLKGNRVSLADYAQKPDKIVPCSAKGCDWSHAKRLEQYLDIISITDKSTGERYAIYTTRADLRRIYTKGNKRGLFCEVEAKRCTDGFTRAQ